MSFTFQQGTKVIIIDGTNRHEMQVSAATVSHTFIESKQAVKTLHRPNLVERTFIKEKGTASLSLSCHLTETEGYLFEWFGFSKVSDKYLIKPLFDQTALSTGKEVLDVYLDAGTTIYKVTGCIAQTLSFKLSRGSILSVDISAQGSDLTTVPSIPETGSLIPQGQPFNGTTVMSGYPLLGGITCEITRDVMWVGRPTLHTAGIFTPNSPLLNGFSISGTITQYKVDDTKTYNESTTINIKYGVSFEINLDICNTTDRWEMGSVHTKKVDYKLLPTAVNSYIKF